MIHPKYLVRLLKSKRRVTLPLFRQLLSFNIFFNYFARYFTILISRYTLTTHPLSVVLSHIYHTIKTYLLGFPLFLYMNINEMNVRAISLWRFYMSPSFIKRYHPPLYTIYSILTLV